MSAGLGLHISMTWITWFTKATRPVLPCRLRVTVPTMLWASASLKASVEVRVPSKGRPEDTLHRKLHCLPRREYRRRLKGKVVLKWRGFWCICILLCGRWEYGLSQQALDADRALCLTPPLYSSERRRQEERVQACPDPPGCACCVFVYNKKIQ